MSAEGRALTMARALMTAAAGRSPAPLHQGGGRPPTRSRPNAFPASLAPCWDPGGPGGAPADMVDHAGRDRFGPPTLDTVIDYHLARVLVWAEGNITEAARQLGVSRPLIYDRLHKWAARADLQPLSPP